MTNVELYIHLIHRLAAYDDATVLAVLLAQGAAEVEVRTTSRKLAEIDLAGTNIDRSKVQRAVARLIKRGLLQTRAHPNKWTGFTVDKDQLSALLTRPLPEAHRMPGLSQQPNSFLARLQAGTAIDEAAGTSPTLHTED